MIGCGRQGEEAHIGSYGSGMRNERGEWLASWTSIRNLAFTNTFFDTPLDERWSYSNGGVRRLIDYILVGQPLLNKVRNAIFDDTIGLGSDHRTASAYMLLASATAEPKDIKRNRTTRKAWAPKDGVKFKNEVGRRIEEARANPSMEWATVDVERKCRAIEQVFA